MREIHEFRIKERYANRLFKDGEGKLLGHSVRKIEISPDDPRFIEIGKMDNQIPQETDGRSHFFSSWGVSRKYSKEELRNAEMFHFISTAYFEPAGQECGTIYDESEVCPRCGAGAKQVSDLVLDLRKVPKSKDIASTISDEIIISERLAEALINTKITGIELLPVKHKTRYQDDPIDLSILPSGRELLHKKEIYAGKTEPGGKFWDWLNSMERKELLERINQEHVEMMLKKDRRKRKPLPQWYQLRITSQPVLFAANTRFGINPFDKDDEGYYRCPLGHTLGLNMISEAFVKLGTWDGSDVVQTAEMIGLRSGLLRPRPIILVSQRVREVLLQTKAKGYKLEVAHLV